MFRRRPQTIRALLIPAAGHRSCEVIAVAYRAAAMSDAIGGGLLADVYYGALNRGYFAAAIAEAAQPDSAGRPDSGGRFCLYADESRVTKKLPANPRADLLAGTLSSELDKRSGAQASNTSQQLLGAMVDWAERQFREMGQPDARDLAVTLIATYQGITILTHSQRDSDLMHRQSRRLKQWITNLPVSIATPEPGRIVSR